MDKQKSIIVQFSGAILITILFVVMGVLIAEKRQQKVLDSETARAAEIQKQACLERGALFVPSIDDSVATGDPFSPLWNDLPRLGVKMTPQAVTMPILRDASVDSMFVQAAIDGHEITWRMVWADSTADLNVDVARFTDAVALQFPLTPDASFMMGGAKQRVQILHWKALWQKDVDEHFQDVQDLHPNYWTDMYWFADGEFPFPVPDAFTNPKSHAWFAAYEAGNPVADFHRKQPVEELIAEGYGSLTHQPESATRGRGVWKDGRWAVLFRRPLRTTDPLDYQLSRGWRGKVALSVWEGSAGNVGGRKHWSDWIEFEVQR